MRSLATVLALLAMAVPAVAQEQVRIGIGFGLAFLPAYVCQDLKLVEKYAKAAHLDVKVSYPRLLGSGPMEEAIESGTIDMGPFGTAPFLVAWEKSKGTPKQAVIVSGMTTMPLDLLTNRPNVESINDIGPTDRIAMPSLTAPQMFLLEMQATKALGRYDRLDDRVIAMPPSEALAALIDGAGMVTAYFASPPYTELALRDSKIHRVLGTDDVIGGKASFLMIGATSAYVEAHPQMPEVIEKAIDEAARIIRDDPRRAAQIYLTHEPSKSLAGPQMEAVLHDIKDEFGSGIYGVKAFADFLSQHGEIKEEPRGWKYIVAPAMMNWPRS